MSFAFGKLFFMGEDLDWTGKRCLLYGLPLTTNITIHENTSNLINIISKHGNEVVSLPELESFINKNSFYDYVRAGLFLWNRDFFSLKGMDLIIESTVPPKSGLGSSAAVLVSLFKTLADYYHIELGEEEICRLGLITEKELVGAVVGAVDFFVSYNGGMMLYDSATNSRSFFNLNLSEYNIVLIYSGFPSDTRVVNNNKLLRYKACENDFIKYIEKTDELVSDALCTIKNHNIVQLGERITQAHYLMSQYLKVSTKEIDDIVRLCNANGAIGTKLTGCGMGGYIFSIIEKQNLEELTTALSEKRLKYMII